MQENVLIVNLPAPYHELNVRTRKKSWKLDAHTHTYYQFIYLLEGMLQIRDGHKQYKLMPGQVCIIPPGHVHALCTVSGYKQFGINLCAENDARGINLLLQSNIKSITVHNNPGMKSYIDAIRRIPEPFDLLAKLKTAALADSFILTCVDAVQDETAASFRKKLLAILEKNLSQKVTLEQITREMLVSQTHLERQCKAAFGCGVITLFQQLKMEKACLMLMNQHIPIHEIAASLGFYDLSHFSRTFKKRVGKTPAMLRIDHTTSE